MDSDACSYRPFQLRSPINPMPHQRLSIPSNHSLTIQGEIGSTSEPSTIVRPSINNHASSDSSTCAICGDRATGKHYGAYSCDGCKGFFRRSVRKNHLYHCRFSRNCTVNKDKRNQCRFCRFTKCLAVGMRQEAPFFPAVQNERDRISNRIPQPNLEDPSGWTRIISIDMLVSGEFLSREHSPVPSDFPVGSLKVAEVCDVIDSMNEQLMNLVTWAKSIPPFRRLITSDQVALLKAHAGEHLVLGITWRSLALQDCLLLGNNCVISKSTQVFIPDESVRRLGQRVMDELVEAFRETRLDENEYACLKALTFFDPGVKGIENIELVKMIRKRIHILLEEYVHHRARTERGRLGQILLILPPVVSITNKLIFQIQYEKYFGQNQMNNLLEEMLLEDEEKSEETSSNELSPEPLKQEPESPGTSHGSFVSDSASSPSSEPPIMLDPQSPRVSSPPRLTIDPSTPNHSLRSLTATSTPSNVSSGNVIPDSRSLNLNLRSFSRDSRIYGLGSFKTEPGIPKIENEYYVTDMRDYETEYVIPKLEPLSSNYSP